MAEERQFQNSDTLDQSSDVYPVPPPREFSVSSYRRTDISRVSDSVIELNIPEPQNLNCDFVYNFYTEDERVNPPTTKIAVGAAFLPDDKIARYAYVNWDPPNLSEFEKQKAATYDVRLESDDLNLSIEKNSSKIVSEDKFLNRGYVNHIFSNVDMIQRGSSDLEAYSMISKDNSESVYKMARYQLARIASIDEKKLDNNEYYRSQLADITDSYLVLSDFPRTSLGLVVTDAAGKREVGESDFIRSIADSLSLNVKINASVIPDIFDSSDAKLRDDMFGNLNSYYASSFSPKTVDTLTVPAVENSNVRNDSPLVYPVKMMGYVLERFRFDGSSFKKEKTVYIESVENTSYKDFDIVYGATYFYSVTAVAAVTVFVDDDITEGQPLITTLYVSSRPISLPMESQDNVPPPPPDNLKFSFDYVKRNVILSWNMPVNPQGDIVQFQVFRRKTIREPFELIAQYSFDKTQPGRRGTRSLTRELVDPNNPQMSEDYRPLVTKTRSAVLAHRDTDFTVDKELFVSSDYIYSVCSVDAHGLISNYSDQFAVTFDSYKNRLDIRHVCSSGSPRQYPNMNLKADAFKDVIRVEGNKSRMMTVYFTPEAMNVKDERNVTQSVVSTQKSARTVYPDGHYVLQLTNLDNQKTQTVKLSVSEKVDLTQQ